MALSALGTGLAVPIARSWGRRAAPPETSFTPRATGSDPEPGARGAAAAILSLSSALGALGQVGAKLHTGEPVPDPPDPAQFDSPTACARSYLPEVDVASGSLDVLCSETDLWTTERALYERLAHRTGGAKHWTRLGRHSMAAVATLRAGCCVEPEPLTAVVPGLWCGALRDRLRAFTSAPPIATIADYEKTIRCLEARAVRLPERWRLVSKEDAETAFDDFLRVARERRKE